MLNQMGWKYETKVVINRCVVEYLRELKKVQKRRLSRKAYPKPEWILRLVAYSAPLNIDHKTWIQNHYC